MVFTGNKQLKQLMGIWDIKLHLQTEAFGTARGSP